MINLVFKNGNVVNIDDVLMGEKFNPKELQRVEYSQKLEQERSEKLANHFGVSALKVTADIGRAPWNDEGKAREHFNEEVANRVIALNAQTLPYVEALTKAWESVGVTFSIYLKNISTAAKNGA